MLTVIPSGRVTPKLKFTLNADLSKCHYRNRIISHPKTKQPLFIEVLGIDFRNKALETMGYNCKFFIAGKEVIYGDFMKKTHKVSFKKK